VVPVAQVPKVVLVVLVAQAVLVDFKES